MTATAEFTLPTEYQEPTRTSPAISIIYGNFKVGKTTIISQLPNHMILSLEPRSNAYHKMRAKEIKNPKEFNLALDYILNNDVNYDFLVIDTITKLDEWSEIVGTLNYMKIPQGKKFNRPAPGQQPYHINDDQFQSVHTLPDGNGYRFSRDVMSAWFKKFEAIIASGKVKAIILLAHIKEKLITNKTGDTVTSVDLNLTGKVKSNYAAYSDALGYMYADGSDRIISFKSSSREKIISGNRAKYLADQDIIISTATDKGEVEVYWEKMYPDIVNS